MTGLTRFADLFGCAIIKVDDLGLVATSVHMSGARAMTRLAAVCFDAAAVCLLRKEMCMGRRAEFVEQLFVTPFTGIRTYIVSCAGGLTLWRRVGLCSGSTSRRRRTARRGRLCSHRKAPSEDQDERNDCETAYLPGCSHVSRPPSAVVESLSLL